MLNLARRVWAELAGATAGTIAPLFALSFFMVVSAVGVAVDSARGYGAKSHLQNAVDAAVLATARRMSEEPSLDVTEAFTIFFNSSRPQAHHIAVGSISVARNGNAVTADVEAGLPTLFMSIVGKDRMEVAARSQAEFGTGDIEVVLALDNTGSMAGSKIASLKTAALDLIDTLSRSAPAPDKLRIGVVPFAKYVNVGLNNRNASWLSVPADYNETVSSCGDTYPNASYTNCRTVWGTCNNDGVPYACSWQECDTNNGTPVYQCTTSTVAHTWNGCVHSRSHPLNVQDGSYATRIPDKMDSTCSQAITPLTSDRTLVRDAINAMTPSGETYIPEGLMWGWRVLSPSEPFTGSLSTGSNSSRVRRFLVLMTDGQNTVSPTADGHHGSDAALANTYTQEACSNIKNDNITVFAVAFEVSDNAIKDVLRACASNNGFFYDASDSAALMSAFDAIGKLLVSLRLTK